MENPISGHNHREEPFERFRGDKLGRSFHISAENKTVRVIQNLSYCPRITCPVSLGRLSSTAPGHGRARLRRPVAPTSNDAERTGISSSNLKGGVV
eukprot:77378-Hanusia_phi.AAC.1